MYTVVIVVVVVVVVLLLLVLLTLLFLASESERGLVASAMRESVCVRKRRVWHRKDTQ
jgi:hypothetical protein